MTAVATERRGRSNCSLDRSTRITVGLGTIRSGLSKLLHAFHSVSCRICAVPPVAVVPLNAHSTCKSASGRGFTNVTTSSLSFLEAEIDSPKGEESSYSTRTAVFDRCGLKREKEW